MNRRLAVVAIALACVIATPAAARHQKSNHQSQNQVIEFCGDRYCNSSQAVAREIITKRGYVYDGRVVAHPAGCPGRQFCGCGSCAEVGISPTECKRRGLFLAANWLRFQRASPGPGMAAVRRGHVMIIRSYDGNGNATVYDPNSGGHKTRVHTRSLRGYHVVNPHVSHMASR